MTKLLRSGLSIGIGLLALLVPHALAAPPQTINYQGYLTSPGGAPVNATVAMTFRIYNASTSGSMVWSETQPSVIVSNGNFNVVLGSVTPVAAAFDVPYWLSVQVGADAEMSPRQPLASSPYAFNALSAASVAAGATIAGSQITGAISNATISGATLLQLQGQLGQSPNLQAPQATTITTSSSFIQGYSAVTVGTDGLPVIAFAGSGTLAVRKCGNASCTTMTVATVDTVPQFSDYFHSVSIAIGADGMPIIAYAHGDGTTNLSALKVAKCVDAACSGAATVTTVDPSGDVGQYASITIGADGLPVVAYLDNANKDLRVLKCFFAACSGAAAIATVDSAGSVGLNVSIAIGADGLPVVAYGSLSAGLSKVAKCGNNTCSVSTINALPTAAGFGLTSIAIGTDGLPVVAVGSSSGVAVTKCADLACTATTASTTVGPPAAFVIYLSLVIPADGLPLVVFNDPSGAPNMILKVAKCSTAACTGSATINTVDSGSAVGTYVSASIGADGLPIMSYMGTGQALRVAKCANPFCAPFFRRR